jgi:UDP-glucuronate 4-epimerase
MKFAVTGAAGFIGSHLAEALIDAGYEVLALDAYRDHYDPAIKERNLSGIDVCRLDLATEPLNELLSGTDGIFHLAAKPGVRSSWGEDFAEYLRDNVLATQRVFEAASRQGVRVVFASSSSVYGEAASHPTPESATPQPLSPYGVTKLSCERLATAYARNFDLDAVTLRYFTVYGPRQRPDMAFARLAAALAEGAGFELYGDGTQSRGFTFVSDAVSATIAAMLEAPSGRTYNVGGGAESTMRDAIALLEEISGRKLDVEIRDRAHGDVSRTSADISRIRSELRWEPRVSLDAGLREQWSWASAHLTSASSPR